MKISLPSLLRIKPGILAKVGKYLKALGIQKVAVYFGEGLHAPLSDAVEASCRRHGVSVIQTETLGTQDARALYEVRMALPREVDGILAVGGGRVVDAGKYLSHLTLLPLLAFPTATSNDGFCSPFASLLFNGEKRTIQARLPQGVALDLDIIRNAPPSFFYSGVGDLISNLTAIVDWKLAFHHSGTYVDDFAVATAQTAVESFIHHPFHSPENLDCLRTLANGLLLSGIAMEISGSSRPASGSEHLISHAYDSLAETQRMHGLQVGVATYLMSLVQNKHTDMIRQTLDQSGFSDFLSSQPLCRKTLRDAITQAPAIKPGFYTILSDPDQRIQAQCFLESDPLMQRLAI
jgi:glycerol-1-phosphate dehydrogenase [NAD(P)+]